MYRDIATTLYKRGEASMGGYEPPSWSWIVVLVNTLIFVPVFLVVGVAPRSSILAPRHTPVAN